MWISSRNFWAPCRRYGEFDYQLGNLSYTQSSRIRFTSICSRFIKELSEPSILVKESKLELIIKGMRFLKLKVRRPFIDSRPKIP